MEVPRHLVGDPLRCRRKRSDRSYIACANLAQLLVRHGDNYFGEAQRAAVEASKAMDDVVEIGKLPGSKSLWVTCDDLLDESGARPRHADDKQRRRRRLAA